MNRSGDHLVDEYLDRLSREASDLPEGRRRELVDEIRAHIEEAREGVDAETEADLRNLLERIGDPAEIVAEERGRAGLDRQKSGSREIWALILLLVGGFVFIVGWFVGLVLLWVSDVWTTREKLVGTLVVPGGLLPAFLILTGAVGGYTEVCGSQGDPRTGEELATVCTGGPSVAARVFWIAFFVFSAVGPLVTTAFLARRMKRPVGGYQPSAGSA